MTYGSTASRYLIGKEDTYGSGVTPEKDVGIVTDVSDNKSKEVIRVPKGIGQRGNKTLKSGTKDLGDSVTFQFQHGRILEYVLGGVSHDETDGDWVHTFTLESTAPSFTSESSESGVSDSGIEKYGNLIDSLSLSIELNGILTGEFSTLASDGDKLDSASSKVLSDLPVFSDSEVSVSIDSSTVPEVQNFSIDFEGVVERSYGIGEDGAQQGSSLEGNFTFSGTVGISNSTYQELLLNDDGFTVQLLADNGVELGSGQRKLEINLKDCVMSSHTKNVSVGELVFVDLEGEGVFDSAESVDDISDTDW